MASIAENEVVLLLFVVVVAVLAVHEMLVHLNPRVCLTGEPLLCTALIQGFTADNSDCVVAKAQCSPSGFPQATLITLNKNIHSTLLFFLPFFMS